jgi:DNA-binding response OmpR family regulator
MNNFLNRERIVLVVEDDPLIREFEAATLKRAGFEVLSAPNGIDGGALFARHFQEVDALVTDISMPGMDGLKLAAFARRIRADLRILFASGSLESDQREAAERIRGSVFLAKPFTADELVISIQKLLEGRARFAISAAPD